MPALPRAEFPSLWRSKRAARLNVNWALTFNQSWKQYQMHLWLRLPEEMRWFLLFCRHLWRRIMCGYTSFSERDFFSYALFLSHPHLVFIPLLGVCGLLSLPTSDTRYTQFHCLFTLVCACVIYEQCASFFCFFFRKTWKNWGKALLENEVFLCL